MSEVAPVTILCQACGSEGRIIRRTRAYDDQGPIDRDEGPCDVCEGTGRELIEDVETAGLEDLP